MQVRMPTAHLGHESELVDWYWDATSVPYGHFLIDLPPRTDDRLRFCTNSGSFPSILKIPDRLEHWKSLYSEQTKSLFSPSVPINFPQRQKSFPSTFSKRVYPGSLPMNSEFAQKKPPKHKKTSRGKDSKRSSVSLIEVINLEANKAPSNRLAANKSQNCSGL